MPPLDCSENKHNSPITYIVLLLHRQSHFEIITNYSEHTIEYTFQNDVFTLCDEWECFVVDRKLEMK